MIALAAAAAAACASAVFLDTAREGVARYHDRAAAIADGYRRIGRDFPSMGEHWIRLSLVFDGRIDPARPEVLNYVVVNGVPRLVGVGYAVPLLDGESAPVFPAGRAAWHDHTRTIDDETVMPHHHEGSASAAGARMAMLHAWIGAPNPAGAFAADNWALPFVRLGLAVPAGAGSSAAKALSLAAGGRSYFELAVTAAAAGESIDRRRVSDAFDRAEADVKAVLQAREGAALDAASMAQLTGIWSALWAALENAVSASARHRLHHLPVR